MKRIGGAVLALALSAAPAALSGAALSGAALSACGGSSPAGDGAQPGGDGGGPVGPDAMPVGEGVTVHLERNAAVVPGGVVSFGVPLPRGAVDDPATVGIRLGGAPVAANVVELLAWHDAAGARTGARAILVQLDVALLATPAEADVEVRWQDGATPPGQTIIPFADDRVSSDSPEVVLQADRTITSAGGVNMLVETATQDRTLFPSRLARMTATFPDGYLAAAGVLGNLQTAAQAAAPARAGLTFFSDQLVAFAAGALYEYDYRLNAGGVPDPVVEYEGWLYDRCATFLTAHVHAGDPRFLLHGARWCHAYATQIELTGENRGIFLGKPDPDTKYSHLRGLYYYYALTGDEAALEAGRAIADLWIDDAAFVAPYRDGHLRSEDALWTERLLGTSLEGLVYGHALTGETRFLDAFEEMLTTATSHITGDAAALAVINPANDFPPQDCFIHNAAQHAEGNLDEPWCSIWMSELMIDALLRWQELTSDPRVDEIFVRLARFLRDTGSAYFDSDLLADSFLAPSICDDPAGGENRRRLVPLYGSGIDGAGVRRLFGDYSDFEHCADATALTAAALRALRRQGAFDDNPVGPFASEGESFVAMHQEFASCAARTFDDNVRPRRDPGAWTSDELAGGLGDPAAFIATNRIGWPIHNLAPQRKLSWWFNMSMLQFALLADAQVALPELTTGHVQPAGCP